MQKYPTDKSTWELPQFVDSHMYKRLEDLPVFETGCDSGYSWSKNFKHLALTFNDGEEFYRNQIAHLLYDGEWQHSKTLHEMDLCFTGGEPMLWQKQMIEIYNSLLSYSSGPEVIQIETNGTQPLSKKFIEWYITNNIGLCWNISPKLFNVSGEQSEDAWHPEVIKSYYALNQYGHLKFVMNNDPRSWNELEDRVKELRDNEVDLPVYVMPAGATKSQQEDSKVVSAIANEAINRGYHVSGRLHAILFGNGLGT
jgi:organic radical activating enzyme